MPADGCLGLRRCFAGLDTLVPRVNKLGTRTSTVTEPRTTATAATIFFRFRDGTAFEAYGTNGCRRECWCVYVGIDQNTKMKMTTLICLKEDLISLGLTFAGIGTLKPPVTSVSVAGTSAIIIPSTARSTTTGFA